MMEALFVSILNMSLAASVAIIAVLVLRLLLRKMPKIFSYVLWAVVLFRLLCPFSFSGTFSVLGAIGMPVSESGQISYVSQEIDYVEFTDIVDLSMEAGEGIVDDEQQKISQHRNAMSQQKFREAPMQLLSLAWMLGITVLIGYSLVRFINLRQHLKNQ